MLSSNISTLIIINLKIAVLGMCGINQYCFYLSSLQLLVDPFRNIN
jgi:hypothetical protein